MKTTRILLATLAAAWIVALMPGPVHAAGDPVIRFQSESDLELDLGMIVDDLLPVFLESEQAGNPAWSGQAGNLVQILGLDALDRARIHSSQSMRGGETRATITLEPGVTDGIIPTLAGTPPGNFAFGKYLDPEGTVAVISMENFAAGFQRLAGLLADTGLPGAARGLTRNADGSLSLMGMNLQEDLFPYLEGELDVILFPLRPGQPAHLPNAALVLGTPDSQAFRDHAFELLGGMMGQEAVEEMRGQDGDIAGAFTFYPLHQGVAYGLGPGFVVVTTDPQGMKDLLAHRQRGIRAPRGRQYVRVNVDRLLAFMGSVAESKGSPSGEDRALADMVASLGDEPIGTVELMTSSRPGEIHMEVHQPGRLWNLEYRMLKQMAAHAGEMKAAREETGSYRDMTGELDRAMTAYGKDHDGVFPETPQDLVDAGYLDAFPDLTPTPLGEYREGGYSYVPLRDRNGTVTGYYLFVYAGGPGTGFDVFTPENVADPATFRIASDGEKDGVVSFCYDGTALAQVEAWRKGQ